MAKKTYLFLILILFLAIFLRFYRLTEVPVSLFGDELDVGYQAYSILKTGRDYSGNPWPIHFQSLADWRTPLFLYATVPSVALFGLTEWGVRFPPAIFGILSIFFFFLLVKQLFKNESLALLASFFLTISPWHIQYSRAAFEVTMMLTFFLAGLYFFFVGIEGKKTWHLALAALFLALTPYIYNTAKLFVPIIILLLGIFFTRQIWSKRKEAILALLVLGLVAFPLLADVVFGEGGSRFSVLSIFTDPTTVPVIGFARLIDAAMRGDEIVLGMKPALTDRIFHNKLLSWGTIFFTNYLRSFSSEFLFTEGDLNLRHSVDKMGMLLFIDAPFLILGIFFVATKLRPKNIRHFLFLWLLAAPIPSALTRDGAHHATRLFFMLPVLMISLTFGVYQFFELIKKVRLRWMLFAGYWLLLAGFFVLYLHHYYVHYPWESQQWWHAGFKEAIAYIKENEERYEKVILSTYDEPPLIFFLAWYQFDPATFQKSLPLPDVIVNQSIEAKKLDKFYLGQNARLDLALDKETLYLAPHSEIKQNLIKEPGRTTPGVILLKAIAYPSGEPAFYLFAGTKESL